MGRFRSLFTNLKDKWEDSDIIEDAKDLLDDSIEEIKDIWTDRDLISLKVKEYFHQPTASYPTNLVSKKQGPPSLGEATDKIGLFIMGAENNLKDENVQHSSKDSSPPSTSNPSKSVSEIQGHPVEVGDQIGQYLMDVSNNLKDENVQQSSKDSTPSLTSHPSKSVSEIQSHHVEVGDQIGLYIMDVSNNLKDENVQHSSKDSTPPSTSYLSKSISEIQGHPVEVRDQVCLAIMDVGNNLIDENVQHLSEDSTLPSTSYPSKSASEIQGHPVEVGDQIVLCIMDARNNLKDENVQHLSKDLTPPLISYPSKSVSEIQGHPVEVGDQIGLYKMDVMNNLTDENVQHSSKDSTSASTSYPSKSVSEILGHRVEVGEKLKSVKILKDGGTANIKSNAAFLGELEQNILNRFSPEELMKFTSGFSDRVGRGGFGSVYRGKLLNGTEIVVKVLEENDFVEETFEVEVSTMFKTCHRYLVKCYGYCFDPTMKALVYEYMENGSLDALLYGNPHKLKWKTFYKIAIMVAKGLSYLHDGCESQIIHHDLKPANVLIDRHLCVKITDFGLARMMNNNVDHVTWTKLRGTPGYIAPEMVLPGSKITYKCDVYSFGMILFEVLGMQRNVRDLDWFPKQVWSKFESGELDQIIDDCGIHKEKYRVRAKVLSMAALWCVQFTPQARPSMSTVVKMLEGEIQVTEPPNPFYPAPEWSFSKFSHSPSFD